MLNIELKKGVMAYEQGREKRPLKTGKRQPFIGHRPWLFHSKFTIQNL